jgi:hypothetical protein
MTARLARAALILTALVIALLPLPSRLVEAWFSRSLYPAIQHTVTPLTNLVPVALADVGIACILVLLVVAAQRTVKRLGLARGAIRAVVFLATFAAGIYLVFLAMWGLNYHRVPLEQRLAFDRARITIDAALRLGDNAVRAVNETYDAAHAVTASGSTLENGFASAQRTLGQNWQATPGVPKLSILQLYFRKAAIDGMTDPFFLEVIINPDAYPFERPFVVTHEWAHLAGYANEAEANFVAWLSCLQGDALMRYSGWLAIYEHVAIVLSKNERTMLAKQLTAGPRRDLEQMADRYARASPVVRDAARDVYDTYLRANRVEGGIASYQGVVRLILGAGVEDGRVPQMR